MSSPTLKPIVVFSSILIQLYFPTETAAQDHARPFPAEVDHFTLEVTERGLNKLTMLPMGVHTDNETRFIFSGHQKGGNVAATLLGIPGIIVSSEINATRGAKRLGNFELNEANLIEEMAVSAINRTFESSKRNPLSAQPGSKAQTYALQVSPYGTIIQSKKNGTKLHAMIVVRLVDAASPEKPLWKSQFYGEADGALDDDTLKDSGLLYQRLDLAFERAAWGAARIVLDDFETYQPIIAKGWLAWFRKPGELPCILLHSEDNKSLLRLPFGAIVAGAGYNIVNSQSLETKRLKKLKDKFKSDFVR